MKTRGEKVIAFIERYCVVPEGALVGRPMVLLDFQKRFIIDIYDNPEGTRRAYLSIARKNGKSGLIAALLLAHLVGPEARQNSQIVCGASSRDQAGIVFGLASKMLLLSSELAKLCRVVPSKKEIVGLARNVTFRSLAADATTAHGLSPVLAILDEVGQIKGPHSPFVEAIETAQGAHDDPLLIAISTQAATDADLFSTWLDDAGEDPQIVSHLYAAPEDCELSDQEAWAAANPALGAFRNIDDMLHFSEQAARLPSKEASFRWLYLNQRIDASSPFISPAVWRLNKGDPGEISGPVYAGLDLSEVNDLTAFVALNPIGDQWGVHPHFWLPGDGLRAKALADRVPWDVLHRQGHLKTTPGPTVDYEFIAHFLFEFCSLHTVRKIAFDRWNYRHLRPWLSKAGFSDDQLDTKSATGIFIGFGQGFQSISPAMRDLEAALLNGRMLHGGHPVLEDCARNSVIEMDAAGNRKLSKRRSRGRIDGMVAMTMAMGAAVNDGADVGPSVYEERGVLFA